MLFAVVEKLRIVSSPVENQEEEEDEEEDDDDDDDDDGDDWGRGKENLECLPILPTHTRFECCHSNMTGNTTIP